jgi:hypothetical protein
MGSFWVHGARLRPDGFFFISPKRCITDTKAWDQRPPRDFSPRAFHMLIESRGIPVGLIL